MHIHTYTNTHTNTCVQLSSNYRVPKVVNNGTKPINYTTIATVPVGMWRVGLESYCIKLCTYIFHNAVGTRKRGKCGDCQGCTEQHDCGTCINCKDKPKFGGPGRKKQCCIKRKCKYELLYQVRDPLTTDSCSTRHTTCQEGKNRWHCYSTIYTHIFSEYPH